MCGFLLQVTGQVDDWQSRKGTFLLQNNTRTVSRRTTSNSRTATAFVKIKKRGGSWKPWCRCHSLYTETLRWRQSCSVESPRYTASLQTFHHTLLLLGFFFFMFLGEDVLLMKSYPYGPQDSSSCILDDISWVCICHGWQWQSWCFYLPLWAEMTAASTWGAERV